MEIQGRWKPDVHSWRAVSNAADLIWFSLDMRKLAAYLLILSVIAIADNN